MNPKKRNVNKEIVNLFHYHDFIYDKFNYFFLIFVLFLQLTRNIKITFNFV